MSDHVHARSHPPGSPAHVHLPDGVAALVDGDALAAAHVDALLRVVPPRDPVTRPDASARAER
ncbi:peptidyl-prolyl cis-trans isomerase, partial [Streptomyces sp. ActVer]|nr:peptidyl-prolyl cis-trans isomerase [Streptomyces sp. ActVer]